MAGDFGTETEYDGRGINGAVTIADVNGDGLPDIIVANQNDPETFYNGSDGGNVTILLNTGGGSFAPGVTYDLPDFLGKSTYGGGPSGAFADVTTADVNGDGRPDIIVSDGHGNLIVVPNEGQGVFGTPSYYPVLNSNEYSYGTNVVAVDVNGDGKPDLLIGDGDPATTGPTDDTGVALLLNNGAGGFAAPVVYDSTPPGGGYSGPVTLAFAVADLNGDGLPDLITDHGLSKGESGGDVSVLLNNGAGGFGAARIIAPGAVDAIAAGDLNGDGSADLVFDGGGAQAAFVSVSLNDGSGGFGDRVDSYDLAPGLAPGAVTLADLNGDGAPDIVVAAGGQTEVLLNDGHGGFGAPTVYSGFGATAAADLAGTGALDLVGPDGDLQTPAGLSQSIVVGLQPGTGPAVCYAAGARILTDRGEVAVEALRVGDLVFTLLGQGFAPVRWLGHHTLDLRAHPTPDKVQPVRILAGAFGEGRPRRDLRVSPGHAIYVDGVLIQAERLVNGATILLEDADTVTYWHVELDRHDVLIADGLPAESYLDTGNRTAFVGGGAYVELHPDFAPRHWSATCAPLVQDGPLLQAARARLRDTAAALGFAVTGEPGLHVLADGIAVPARAVSGGVALFELPQGCRDIRLASATWVPAWTLAGSDDTRRLGICVRRLVVDGRSLDLDDAAPSEGWALPEPSSGDEPPARWTTGRASLPPGAREILVELCGTFAAWSPPSTPLDAARIASHAG